MHEEYGQKDTLLNELTVLCAEKELAQEQTAQAAVREREFTTKMRADACKTLGNKEAVQTNQQARQ